MPVSISWLTKAQNGYISVGHLRESVPAPDEDPMQGKYDAREKLISLLDEALVFANEPTVDKYSPSRLLSILFQHDIGVIDQETEELETSEEYLTKARTLLEEWFPDDPLLIILRLKVLNQLAFVHTMTLDYDQGLSLLCKANDYYEEWLTFKGGITEKGSKGREPRCVIEVNDCFAFKFDEKLQRPEAENEVEKVHTTTLFYLAQIYERLGDSAKSANCCYRTLKKQIALNHFKTMEWCINLATLAEYFSGINRYAVASHMLRAARYMMDNREEIAGVKLGIDDDETVAKGRADYERIVVKYYLMLFEYSLAKDKNSVQEDPSSIEEFRFITEDELNKKNVIEIRYRPITDYQTAVEIFKLGKQFIDQAKEYYTLNEQASDYVDCIQDMSRLYRYMAMFITDSDVKSKTLKRRVDLLEGVLSEINPRLFLNQVRQMYIDLGEIYYEMYEIKVNKPIETSRQAIRKTNHLLTRSGENYKLFIDTWLSTVREESVPRKVPDEIVKPLIVAYFTLGRCYSNLFCIEPKEKVANWEKCLQYYDQAIKYLEVNPDQKEIAHEELKLIQEMKDLIPQRIAQIVRSNVVS